MADRLNFSLYFDLKNAVDNAGKEWDSKYADMLEKKIQQRALGIKLKIDTKSIDSLDAIKQRLAAIKIEPITPETKDSIKALVRELRLLASALKQVQRFAKNTIPLGQTNFRNDVQLEKLRIANERLEIQKRRVALAEQKHADAMQRSAARMRSESLEMRNHSGIIERYIKRLIAYWSIQQVSGFLQSVRDVTAQFELQRVSLSAILRDQAKGQQLFSQIKSFAVKSPISIMDLTSSVKQLAAYRIDSDALFDTTKRLSDVSVGLGVDRQRLILAYGQVKAAVFLRASEVRQFTEAGIPMLELLADRFTRMNGQMVSTGEVMQMITERGVTFKDVEAVFKDMTSAGGAFYNMQEKQGNTLFGLWAKLGDAASIMYDEIGNTSSVNRGIKTLIEGITVLIQHWRETGAALSVVAVAIGAYIAKMKFNAATVRLTALSTKNLTLATEQLRLAVTSGNAAQRIYAKNLLRIATLQQKAAMSTNIFTRALYQAKAALAGIGKAGWIMLAVSAVAELVIWLSSLDSKIKKLNSDITNAQSEGEQKGAAAVSHFNMLANMAARSALGSKEQKNALEELARTYGEIIPAELLTIDNLRAMKGHYESLTAAIQAYHAETARTNAVNAVEEWLSGENKNYQQNLPTKMAANLTIEAGRTTSLEEMQQLLTNIELKARSGASAADALRDAWRELYGEEIKNTEYLALYSGGLIDFVKNINLATEKINGINKATNDGAFSLNKYVQGFYAAAETIKNGLPTNSDGKLFTTEVVPIKKVEIFRTEESFDLETPTRTVSEFVDDIETKMEHLRTTTSQSMTEMLLQAGVDIAAVNSQYQQAMVSGTNSFLNQQVQNNAIILSMFAQLKSGLGQFGVAIPEEFYNLQSTVQQGAETLVSSIDFDGLREYLNGKGEFIGKAFALGLVGAMQREYDKNGWNLSGVEKDYNQTLANMAAKAGDAGDMIFRYLVTAGGSFRDLKKQAEEALSGIEDKIAATRTFMLRNPLQARIELVSLEQQRQMLTGIIAETSKRIAAPATTAPAPRRKSSGGGSAKQDPRLNNLKEEISLIQKLYNEYKQLEKQEGAAVAVSDMQRLANETIKLFKEKYKFELPTNVSGLVSQLEILYKEMAKLPAKAFKDLPKELKELRWTIEKINIDEAQRKIEEQLKLLSERIKRSKIAKEFYNNILSQTGDVELATRISLSIYGSTGKELFEQTVQQIRDIFRTGTEDNPIAIDISGAIDEKNQRINYRKLAEIYDKYQNEIIEKNRDTARQIVSEGQSVAADNALTWEKELAKEESYEQKRTAIINRESQRRADIIKSDLKQRDKDRLIALSHKRQKKDLTELDVEEFQAGDDYIKAFENLTNSSTATLQRLRDELQQYLAKSPQLSPEKVKAVTKALEDLDKELLGRSIGSGIEQGVKRYIDAAKKLQKAKLDAKTAKAEYDTQEPQLNAEISAAKSAEITAELELNILRSSGLATENDIVAAELKLNNAKKRTALAEKKKTDAVNKYKDKLKNVTEQEDEQRDALEDIEKDLKNAAQAADKLAGLLGDVKDLLGISADSSAGLVFDSAIAGLQSMSKAITIATTGMEIFNAISSANPIGIIAAAIGALMAFGQFMIGAKVRKANKEIEKQQKIIDKLEYAFDRLQKAAEKLFGTDYLRNFNSEMQNLDAQRIAYMRQLEAERSKGKKADKEKIKDYEEKIRDTADKMKELQDELTSHFTGTDRSSAAREFAQSWLEAKATFANTTDAIKDKYKDMVKNMIIEGAAAKIIDNILAPMWAQMDKMLEKNNMQGAIDYLVNGMDSFMTQADNGMNVLWKALEARGYDMRKLFGDTETNATGIAREFATASEESINGLAAMYNTNNYYVSHLPGIGANVAAIRAMLGGGDDSATAMQGRTSADTTALWNQHLELQQGVFKNTAETVKECREIAKQCANMANDIRKVVVPKGIKGAHGVQVYM